MEIFSKDLISRNRNYQIIDKYQEQVEKTKNKVVTMQNLNLTEYSTTKQALQYYSRGVILAMIGLLTSAITYPLSIKIVKRFGVRDFLNIHMAALPIIMNVNAFVLGVSQGFINHNLLMRKYPHDLPIIEQL